MPGSWEGRAAAVCVWGPSSESGVMHPKVALLWYFFNLSQTQPC